MMRWTHLKSLEKTPPSAVKLLQSGQKKVEQFGVPEELIEKTTRQLMQYYNTLLTTVESLRETKHQLFLLDCISEEHYDFLRNIDEELLKALSKLDPNVFIELSELTTEDVDIIREMHPSLLAWILKLPKSVVSTLAGCTHGAIDQLNEGNGHAEVDQKMEGKGRGRKTSTQTHY